MPDPRAARRRADACLAPDGAEALDFAVACRQSGYIRFIDIGGCWRSRKAARICVRVERRVGHFVPEGVPLMLLSHGDRLITEDARRSAAAFDIGPARTLQQDVEFGVIQIVDIGLQGDLAGGERSEHGDQLHRSARPHHDPLGRPRPPASACSTRRTCCGVTMPWIGFDGLLDTAFEQIRHYAKSDVAVSLRLLRALGDIAVTTSDPAIRGQLLALANRVMEGARDRLDEAAVARLGDRLAALHTIVGPPPFLRV